MNSYHNQYAQADYRRETLLREAEADRLSQVYEQPGLADRLLTNVGEWMVSEGTRLKNRTPESKSADAPQNVLRAEF